MSLSLKRFLLSLTLYHSSFSIEHPKSFSIEHPKIRKTRSLSLNVFSTGSTCRRHLRQTTSIALYLPFSSPSNSISLAFNFRGDSASLSACDGLYRHLLRPTPSRHQFAATRASIQTPAIAVILSGLAVAIQSRGVALAFPSHPSSSCSAAVRPDPATVASPVRDDLLLPASRCRRSRFLVREHRDYAAVGSGSNCRRLLPHFWP